MRTEIPSSHCNEGIMRFLAHTSAVGFVTIRPTKPGIDLDIRGQNPDEDGRFSVMGQRDFEEGT
jgi:hypothetical protein